MKRETISIRLGSEKKEALDAVASALDRDRTTFARDGGRRMPASSPLKLK
jgi:predicted transcriptional regulator